MIEVQILIPLMDNAGVPFPSIRHDLFEQELLQLFGASSQFPGVVSGQWIFSGQVYRDDTRVYVVAVDGIIAKGDALRSAVTFAKPITVSLLYMSGILALVKYCKFFHSRLESKSWEKGELDEHLYHAIR
jgi:hypothetical protein